MSHIAKAIADSQAMLGQEIGVSDWVLVDQARINAFAETTLDDQWIHTDPVRAAKESPFGGSVGHGFLTLSLASRFIAEGLPDIPGRVMGINYGFEKIRFLAPVLAGSRLRGRFTLTSMKQRNPTQLLREVALTVEIEGRPDPALIADWLTLIVFEP